MIRKYCDRCGKDMTPKPQSPLIGLCKSISKTLSGVSFSFSVDTTPHYIVKRTDEEDCILCNDCEKDFEQFMKNEKLSGKDVSVIVLDERNKLKKK